MARIPGRVARNQPCPCGSGRRYKHCCGDGDNRRATDQRTVPIAETGDGRPVLSIVMPWFHKLADFRRVLPLNALYFARPGIEVVLALDEPSEEAPLLALLKEYDNIRWRVVVNDRPHGWRPPCRALNVGIRQSRGDYILVLSPESAFVTDVAAIALRALWEHPDSAVVGQVGFGLFGELTSQSDLDHLFARAVPDSMRLETFYGSIAASRGAFEAIGGYDEALSYWGGDDDNLRVRLEMAGYDNIASVQMRLLHLSDEPRTGGEQYDPDADFRKCSPASAVANGSDWGRSFDRLAYRWDPPERAAAAESWSGALVSVIPQLPLMKLGSRRQCPACGRLVHHTRPAFHCASCGAQTEHGRGAQDERPSPRIACLMQLHNEERNLPGCLRHLRDHVDGIIALDDGSADATARILAREPKVAARLHNPPRSDHHWREIDNKRVLLEKARELGYDWVLVCDADERYETLFLERMHEVAGSFPESGLWGLSFSLRELWDDPWHYRIDGIWDRKRQARFFRVPERIEFHPDRALHGPWYPEQVHREGTIYRSRYQLYHLKMIRRDDRLRRRDMYRALDPDSRFQPEGYDYLAEEGDGLVLETIAPERAYDGTTLPEDLLDARGNPSARAAAGGGEN